MDRIDPHTGYEAGMPKMVDVSLELDVDFSTKTLRGIAWITFDRGEAITTLDTRDLVIQQIVDHGECQIDFTKSDPHPVRGTTIRFMVPKDKVVEILYETSPQASGLQWIDASQTIGTRHPCMFTQGQSLHAASYIPCQNSPSVRFTFTAAVSVPRGVRALMGGSNLSRDGFDREVSTEVWQMRQPIPAYLFTLAVGDFVGYEITSRCQVYAEQGVIAKAADEFMDIGRMLEVIEKQFGPYVWERFDMLVMPPSFPFGGMENPRLAFLSPTIIAGDRSSIDVLAHELAHSWTGNLIGNARWCDFWLNEGWTTYLEWRIIEMLYGRERMLLSMHVGLCELEKSFASLHERGLSQYTALSAPIPDDLDPDDILTQVPYVKGALFIGMLEHAVGRERFDAFIRRYIEHFSFKTLTTEEFLEFIEDELPGVQVKVKANEWVYGQGLPQNAPLIVSTLAREVKEMMREWPCSDENEQRWIDRAQQWTEGQWHLALEFVTIADSLSLHDLTRLDDIFALSRRKNIDVRAAFLRLAAEHSFERWADEIEGFLCAIGRLKYLKPIYQALAQTALGYDRAVRIFEKARVGYHPIAIDQIQKLLERMKLSGILNINF